MPGTKLIPDLSEKTTLVSTDLIPVDSGIQTFKMRASKFGELIYQFLKRLVAEGTNTDPLISASTYIATSDGVNIELRKSRGVTVGAHTIVQNNDTLAKVTVKGSNGTAFDNAAIMEVAVDGTPGASNDMPTRLDFYTSVDGSATPAIALRLNAAGQTLNRGGSAALPGVSFTGDSNTGMYSDGSDAIAWSTNGTKRMGLDAGGRFGVGPNGALANAMIAAVSSSSGQYAGYFGQTVDNLGALYAECSGASFANRLIEGITSRAPNSAFSMLRFGAGSNVIFNFRGDGQGFQDAGTAWGTPADYAEFFEWADGNPDDEDRVGQSVALDANGKIKRAEVGDTIIGVVSADPAVVGDAGWNNWRGKWLRDNYGRLILDENGDRQLNPDFDPDQEYVPRSDRKEWDAIGLLGKLYVKDGEEIGANWLPLGASAHGVRRYLVR